MCQACRGMARVSISTCVGAVISKLSFYTSMLDTPLDSCIQNMNGSARTLVHSQFPSQNSCYISHCALAEGSPGMVRLGTQIFPGEVSVPSEPSTAAL